ncbi:MAG: alternative ribosome rescue aminoacyl-tRNA hydrolase ArfB [Bacteroidetes bacterium]|nr:alternative ribosome rescue aminoacyl-tRNA hydrolase ArfB [Bacteroidota bacterium]
MKDRLGIMDYFCQMPTIMDDRDFIGEMHFSASRSRGPGGQNVNKVSTKMELRFHVASSALLSEEEKILVEDKLASRINAAGELVLVSQSERSQLQNKDKVIEKFYALLTRALTPRKKRKPTRPSRASKEERLEVKRQQSEKKERRKM